MKSPVAEILLDGVLLRREAVEMGIDDNALTRAVRYGVLARIRHGAYADADEWAAAGPVRRHQLLSRAVLRQYDDRVALSHQSATLGWDAPTWNLDLRRVHLTHLAGNGRREAGIVHHHGACDDDDVVVRDGLRMTTPARTALDIASREPIETGVVVASHFLKHDLATKDELAALFNDRTRWPGHLTARVALGLADGRLESVGESRCWSMFWAHQFPMPIPQFEVVDRRGRFVGRVDFAWPELGLIVEFDGREKYERYRRPGESVEDVIVRERRRENRVREVTGWEVIRLTWADLARPDLVMARIHAVLERRAS